jgi:hypothetical protein
VGDGVSDFWTFASNNPLTALLIVWIVMYAATRPFKYAMRAYIRRLRSRDIQAHGWPRIPMDADGDIVYPDKDEAA